jgi:ABC-type branched-subunit amino acid transport system substrate-binding protein
MRKVVRLATVVGVVATSSGIAVAASGISAGAASSTTPIVVGGSSSLATAAGIDAGFRAGIYRFNKSGGLNGRKIQFLGSLDDGFSPTTALNNVQQLVQNKHVMVVAPIASATDTTSAGNFLAANKVPFIGWATSGAFPAQPKWGFGINGYATSPNSIGLSDYRQILSITGNTKTPGKIKIAFIAEDIAEGISANNSEAKGATYVGMKVVYHQGPIAIIGTTTYAPYAQALISSGANTVFETLDSPDSVGLAAALRSAGFKGVILNALTYYPGQLASEPSQAAALNGVYVTNPFPLNENNTPAVKQAEKDLVSTGQQPYLTAGISEGYWSSIFLEQALKATLKSVGGNPNKVTSVTLQQVLASSNGYTYTDPIPGGIGAETFPAASKYPTGCGTIVKTVGTSYKQMAPYQCLGVLNTTTNKQINPMTGQPVSK